MYTSGPLEGEHLSTRHLSTKGETAPLVHDKTPEDPPKNDDVQPTKSLLETVYLVPHMEPMCATKFFKLSVICAILPAIFILALSNLGFGEEVIIWSRRYQSYHSLMERYIIGILAFLYLFDVEKWKSSFASCFRFLLFSILFLSVGLLAVFISVDHPYFSLCIFSVYMPIWLYGCKYLFYPRKSTNDYVIWLSGPLFLVGWLIILVWVFWTAADDENRWSRMTKIIYSEEVGCKPDYYMQPQCFDATNNQTCFHTVTEIKEGGTWRDKYRNRYVEYGDASGCDDTCAKIYDTCFHSFTAWVWPMMAGTSMLFLSFVSAFLRPQHESIGQPATFMKIWIILFFAMWIAAGISGVGTGLTEALTKFILSLVISVFALAIGIIDLEKYKEEAWEKLTSDYENVLEMMKSVLILFGPIPLVFYLLLSFVNQTIRKMLACCSRSKPRGCFTEATSTQLNQMKSWNWVKIITNAVFCGAIYMALAVLITQFTTLFLSCLIDFTKEMSLLMVTIIMFMVGLLLFVLVPPIPGVPIYLASGIVLVNSGLPIFGLFGAISFTVAFAILLKLFTCVVQQKMIGEQMSDSVAIRQAVAINSGPMRAAKLVLNDKQLTLAKVAFLSGGPDWPTSVLCGIMRVDTLPIIIGTFPVIFIILLSVLTGACMYLKSLPEMDDGKAQYPWAETGRTISIMACAAVQICFMAGAAIVIERTMSERKEELEQLGIDVDVHNADKTAGHKAMIFDQCTSWDKISCCSKFMLSLALLFMILSVHIDFIFGDRCFVEYELIYTIKDNLDGNILNFVKPYGWIAMGSFCLSYLCISVFNHSANKAVILFGFRELPEGSNLT